MSSAQPVSIIVTGIVVVSKYKFREILTKESNAWVGSAKNELVYCPIWQGSSILTPSVTDRSEERPLLMDNFFRRDK